MPCLYLLCDTTLPGKMSKHCRGSFYSPVRLCWGCLALGRSKHALRGLLRECVGWGVPMHACRRAWGKKCLLAGEERSHLVGQRLQESCLLLGFSASLWMPTASVIDGYMTTSDVLLALRVAMLQQEPGAERGAMQ